MIYEVELGTLGGPQRTFSDIWEKDGRWLLGPRILADVVRFTENKGLVALTDEGDPSRLRLSVPLPYQAEHVPEELRDIFAHCIMNAARSWSANVSLERYLGMAMTTHNLAIINNEMTAIAAERQACEDGLQLHRLLCDNFGLAWFALPSTAFAADAPTFSFP